MSDRGSFVTEFIYCERCLDHAKRILIQEKRHSKNYYATQLHYGQFFYKTPIPIIAGKVTGLYAGEEIDVVAGEFADMLRAVICCTLRIAVLAESGEEIITIQPLEINKAPHAYHAYNKTSGAWMK